MVKKWEIDLQSCPASKSNRRQWFGPGMSAKSEAAQTFTEFSILTIRATGEPSPFEKDDEIEMFCTVRYPSWRNDLDCELVCDVLQKAGVVPNDRQIRVKHYDTDDPPGKPYTSIRLESHRKLRRK